MKTVHKFTKTQRRECVVILHSRFITNKSYRGNKLNLYIHWSSGNTYNTPNISTGETKGSFYILYTGKTSLLKPD